MSVRNKVNVVSAGQYSAELKWLVSEGKDETSAGIFSSGHQSSAWISSGDRLAVLGTNKGNLHSVFSFGEDSNDPVDVTCVEELEVDCSKLTPLVLACTSSLRQDRLHVVNPANSRVLRTVDLGNLQVRCMAVVDDGRSSLNSLTEVLAQMNGVVALGCSNGAVILVDLHRELVVRAYREYWRRTETSLPLKYVSDGPDEEAKIAEIEEAQRCGASAAITLIEGDDSDADCGVTALSFSRETACLYVGYSSGLWQVWNLAVPNFSMLYECAECTTPVAHFCQIEPCEDPRPTVYLWVNHEGTSTSMPLFNMYSLCYHNKVQVQEYGTYYQDFIAGSRSFSMYPGEEFANVVSGKLLSSAPYSKTLKRALLQNMGLPAMEGIQMKLIITAFSLTYTRGSTHTYLCVFDLDQWYKEQMPVEPNCGDASYIDTIELSSEPLLASDVKIDSVSIFHTEVPQEIHLVPQALSFSVIGLSESGLVHIEKIGLQKLWLTNTELIGAKSLVHPTKLFHACVSAGLMPTFPAQVNSDINSPTNEEMRSYILSVWLENGLEHVILEVAKQWENGAHSASNCTLNFLFDWVWSSISSTYNAVNAVCETLFSASGHEIDVGIKRRLQHCRLILSRLHFIQSAFYSKYSNPLYKGILETRYKAIDIIKLFVVQLTWFMNVGLLPEANSEDKPQSAVRYEYIKLDNYASERRQFLSNVSAKLKRAGKPCEMPGGSLYLVDHFLHDYPEIGRQWEEEGGINSYPPPSIQSLLRTLRIQNVPTSIKLSIVQYALLDMVNVMDKAKHDRLLPKILKYHFMLPEGHENLTRVIQGLWHLDHGLHEEGLNLLLHRNITVSDLSERLHRAVVRVLFFDGKAHLALQYLRLRNPRLTLPEDLKLEMSLLLAKKLTSEAYHFQKHHSYIRNDLLEQFFSESLFNGEISKVINFPLDDNELRVFDDYLAKHVSQRNDDIRVLLRLTRKKYNEAKYLHDRLLALHEPKDPIRAENRDMIVKGFLSTIPKVSQLMYLQKRKGDYKNLPEFKSSKPRPLGLFPIGANGKPILNPTDEQLCASALAATANFCKRNPECKLEEGVFDGEPKIYPAETVSPRSMGGFDGPASRKRTLNMVAGSNKRQRMDDMVDDTADDDISAFVGTPLVKRRSKELGDLSTPLTMVKQSRFHSILKSNKTPASPGRSVGFECEEGGTPKKTLRWDIPSEGGTSLQAARKSLLSSSISTPTKEQCTPSKAAARETPRPIDSIKSRLRSHTATPTSVNKKGTANWSEIAEEVKPKVLFSTNLPTKKEKSSKPAKPVGPSFVEQLNVLKSEEQKRKEEKERQPSVKETLLAAGEFPDVEPSKQKNVEHEGMDVDADKDVFEEEEDVGSESSTPGKHKFDNLTVESDELSILNTSGSPFTTRTLPKQLRNEILAKLTKQEVRQGTSKSGNEETVQPKSVTESVKKSAKPVQKDHESDESEVDNDGVEDYEDGEISEDDDEKINEYADAITDDDDDVVEVTDSSPSVSGSKKGSSPQAETVASRPATTLEKPESSPTAVPSENVDNVRKPPEEHDIAPEEHDIAPKDPLSVEDASDAEEGFLKISAVSSIAQDDAPTPSKQNTDVLSATPQIGTKVVSLSQSPYPDDEDEVGSEDPEEAEIPPVIEFSQPEEGLLIDPNYSLKDQLEESMGDSEDVDNDLRGLAKIAGEESADDSGSSVICLDSESDEEPKNKTQLDYEGEDSYTFDSEEAGNSSRGRRSFFHDKYNTHQEESESPSPEYSSDEGQKDVDLYNIDAIDQEDDDGVSKEVELEDEIFGLGRGLQRSKEDVSSENEDEEEEEEDEEEDEDVEEEEEGEDEEDEEEDLDEPSRGARVSDDDSESDSDVQEISSEEEAPSPQKIVNPKARLREMLKAASAAGTSSTPKPEAPQISMAHQAKEESQDVESTESSRSEPEEEPSPKYESLKTQEDQAAVDALLSFAEVKTPAEAPVEEPENPEVQASKPVTPSKTPDVIDFNLSQGQMFFGSPPESEVRDTRSDRALFQWKTFSSKEASEKQEGEPMEVAEAKSEEALNLQIDEADLQPASSEENQSSVEKLLTSEPVESTECVGTSSEVVSVDTRKQEPVVIAIEVETEGEQLELADSKVNVAAEIPLTAESQVAKSPAVECIPTEPLNAPVELLQPTSTATEVVGLEERDPVPTVETATMPQAAPVPQAETSLPAESQVAEKKGPISTVFETAAVPQAKTPSPTEPQGTESREKDNTTESTVTETTGKEQTPSESKATTSAIKEVASTEPNKPASCPSKESVSESTLQSIAQNVLVTPEKSIIPSKVGSDMKSFTCQTSFFDTLPSPRIEKAFKSFSCQAAMDITRSGVRAPTSVHIEEVADCGSEVLASHAPEVVKPKETQAWVIPEIVVQGPNGDEHSPMILEPPTPFKTSRSTVERDALSPKAAELSVVCSSSPKVTAPGSLKDGGQSEEEPSLRFVRNGSAGSPKGEPQSEIPTSPKVSELSGVGILDDDEDDERLTIDEDENPCDVAFVGEAPDISIPSTPKTPMAPLRKSVRLSRMATPGRALAPDDEVNVSDSILDVAAVDMEVSEGELKPTMVNRSVITDEHGEDIARKSRQSRKSSKPSRESTKIAKEKRDGRSRSRSTSVDPEVVKQNLEAAEKSKELKTSAPSSEPELVEVQQPKSKDADETKPRCAVPQPKDVEKGRGSRNRRSSSVQPETTEPPAVEKLRRSPRRSLAVDQLSTQTVEVRRSPRIRRSSESGSSVSSVPSKASNRNRRHSLVEPGSCITRQPARSRRASSECPELSSQGSRGSSIYSEDTASTHHSKKRQRSSDRGSESPPKLMRMGLPEASNEYRKRKIRHSITEPLEKKKHHFDVPGDPRAGTSRASEPGYGTEEEPSRPRKKARSLHDYPTRRSARPTLLESIEEVPEDSFGKRASSEDLTATSSRLRPSRPLDISKWLALSKSQVSKARRLAGKPDVANSPVAKRQTCFSITLPQSPGDRTPDREISPSNESIVSIASTASSKVLRSGRTIDENTPTKRPRKSLAQRQLAKKALQVSPRQTSRSGRPVGNHDRTTAASDSDDDVSSVSTLASSRQTSASASVVSHDPGQDVNVGDMMSSRRLTRGQRSMLEMSMSRGGLSPVEESPAPTPKSKPRKKR